MEPLLANPSTLVGVAAVAVLLGGLFLVWMVLRRASRRVTALEQENSRLESQNREQARTLARQRLEQKSTTKLARVLPKVVRDLNSPDLDLRAIPGLIAQLTEALFEPQQILVYQAGPDGALRQGEPGNLILVDYTGLTDIPDSIRRVPIGQGKIGWVAAHHVEMFKEDWLNLTRTEGRSFPDPHPSIQLDMVAPMVIHRQGSQDEVAGVLCVGNPSLRPRDDRLMLQLITNLGAMAYMIVRNTQALRDQAHHDGLTGLLNKRHFMVRLGEMIHRADQEGQNLAVFIFDIDHFKNYNDANGHLAGDELLRRMAQILRQSVRPSDLVCRYGGEEFVVVMPDTGAEIALRLAERIRAAIASHPFPHAASQPGGRVTISGGVACFPRDGQSSTELIGNADQALYQAKAGGRNRVLRYRGVEIGQMPDEGGPTSPPRPAAPA